MAILLQDYAPFSTMSHADVEKEVIECMTRALKNLEVELHCPSSNPSTPSSTSLSTLLCITTTTQIPKQIRCNTIHTRY
ncbi:unnamed protein product [Rotaria sp. Silwood1]|nr:unnamed protein product [Rotaria sp. Silwood1]